MNASPWARAFLTVPSALATIRMASQPVRRYSFQVFRDTTHLRELRRQLLLANRSVGLVPTMGALHEGHLSLIRFAAKENTDVFVSIFVNPTQFGVNEDLESYPRTWESDMTKLEALNKGFARANGDYSSSKSNGEAMGRITAVFAPSSKTMYPTLPPSSEINGNGSFVTITPLSRKLEGASRPVFFRGVATVCMKLFNIVTPDRAYFGQKDIQQTAVIKRMVADFHLGMDIRIGPTTREDGGLAMSSRNVYLGSRRRAVGLVLFNALKEAERQYESGAISREEILGPANRTAERVLYEQQALPPSERVLYEVDYISLAHPDTMEELDVVDPAKGAILSGAIKMSPLEEQKPGEDSGLGEGNVPVRLIDNIVLKSRT